MARKKHPVGPCGKILFATEADANTRAFYLNNVASNHPAPMRSYICTQCRGYHLTSKPFVSHDEHEKRKKETCSECGHFRPEHAVDGMCWAAKSKMTLESVCPCTKFIPAKEPKP